jgi:hypothetical protein
LPLNQIRQAQAALTTLADPDEARRAQTEDLSRFLAGLRAKPIPPGGELDNAPGDGGPAMTR